MVVGAIAVLLYGQDLALSYLVYIGLSNAALSAKTNSCQVVNPISPIIILWRISRGRTYHK